MGESPSGGKISSITQFLPMLVATMTAMIAFGIITFWNGRPSPTQLTIYLMTYALFSYLIFEVANETGLLGLFAGEYNEESIASFTALCTMSCKALAGRADLSEVYCGCVVNRARLSLTYGDMIARITAQSTDEIDAVWNRADRVCRFENNLS
jgi:hypothetical protein